jgi:hypothetical protein
MRSQLGGFALALGAVVGIAQPAYAVPRIDPALVAINQADGQVVDISPTRILYQSRVGNEVSLVVKHRLTGALTRVPAGPFQAIDRAQLVPGGALLVALTGPDPQDHVLLWHGGERSADLGPVNTAAAVQVAGRYVFWDIDDHLRRYDVETGRTMVIADDAEEIGFDGQTSGDVLYWSVDPSHVTSTIVRYHNGRHTTVPAATRSASKPIADGDAVVYCGSETFFGMCTLWRWDGEQQVQLAGPLIGPADRLPGNSYQAAGGWTAYVRSDGLLAPPQIWLRAPSAQEFPISASVPAGDDPRVIALSPTGTVLFAIADTLYLASLHQPVEMLASGVGDWESRRQLGLHNAVSYLDAHWLLGAGTTVYLRQSTR